MLSHVTWIMIRSIGHGCVIPCTWSIPTPTTAYSVALRATVHTVVGVVYATTETLSARRHMEYDCVRIHELCCCQHLVTLSYTSTTSYASTLQLAVRVRAYKPPVRAMHTLWASACMLCALMLSPLPSAHQHPSGYGGLDPDPIISRPWIMTMSCSQVCGCRRSLDHHAHAHTLHRTPVAVYVLPSVCYALHR